MISIETTSFLDLPRNSPFKFNADKERKVYWFNKVDGMYAQVFSSQSDMKGFKNPSFVSVATRIEKVKKSKKGE